ncbi:predicted protein [Naegleria gruberi]|uniref:Predicted protein n=1 Tax=Naegleria gruberi TaxID=5762 RepID=D2V6V5_NAEGR|nr:uncharacterized protein NAEGRDRAFT_64570 [Naegleria gruberi]EFC47638.1 predicted protein [Naegleria gruberi]|eukprot:XP_002680382.1 predicted protein [Naegleria gruberi strain NEG-M]
METLAREEFFKLISTGDSVGVWNFIHDYHENAIKLSDFHQDVIVGLELASKYGFLSIFKLLLDELLNNKDELFNGKIKEKRLSECLYLACEMNHLEIVKLILPHIDIVSPRNRGGRYGEFIAPIMKPLQKGYFGIIWWYFEKFSVNLDCYCIPSRGHYDCEKYPLYVAVENGHYNVAQYLLEKGAKVDQFNDHSMITALYRAFELKDEEMIELLLKFGANYRNAKHYILKDDVQEEFNLVISKVLEKMEKKKMKISVNLRANTQYTDVFFNFIN